MIHSSDSIICLPFCVACVKIFAMFYEIGFTELMIRSGFLGCVEGPLLNAPTT